MGWGGVLGDSLVSLRHQLGDGLKQGAVGLNQILDGRDQLLPFALRERNDIIRTEIFYIHDAFSIPCARDPENAFENMFAEVPGQGFEPR